jgi:hypothetical protein
MPVIGYDRHGQEMEIYVDDTKLRREEVDGPCWKWNEDYGQGLPTSSSAKVETRPEEKLVKGLRRPSLFSRHHDE